MSEQQTGQGPVIQQTGLTMKGFEELAGGLDRLRELESMKILTKSTEAELRGLKEFVSRSLHDHAAELLGCWFTVRKEYEPMLKGFTILFGRVQHVNEQTRAVAQAARDARAKQQVGSPANPGNANE